MVFGFRMSTENQSNSDSVDAATATVTGDDTKPAEIKAALTRSSSDSLKRPAEPEFVLVKELVSGEILELPTVESDNTLSTVTLTHAFPGASSLKYKTENGTTRALS